MNALARTLSRLGTTVLFVIMLGCVDSHMIGLSGPRRFLPPGPSAMDAPTMVVWVVLDGVRWQEVFWGTDRTLAERHHLAEHLIRDEAELLPNLTRLGRDGVAVGAPDHGPGLFHSGPNHVSLPAYLEMLWGDKPDACTENDCEPGRRRSVADVFVERNPGRLAGVFSSWDRIGHIQHTQSAVVVSAGRGQTPAQLVGDAFQRSGHRAARDASPSPGHGGYRPDAHTAELALAFLEKHRPSFLFLSLGDTDEHAHDGDYAGYLESLVRADHWIGEIRSVLERQAPSRYILWVTADHGRSISFRDHGRDPESARTWVVAAGSQIEARGRIDTHRAYVIADESHTLLSLSGMSDELRPGARQIGELSRSRSSGADVVN